MRRHPTGKQPKSFWYEPKVSWEDVLAVLAVAEKPLQIREVTERSGIDHRQDTHRRLERLRERGAVRKIREGNSVYWSITDFGKSVYQNIQQG